MYVVDTNVISELRKRDRADPRVLEWAERNDPGLFYLSCITLLELEYGALLIARRDPVQGRLMRRWVEREIMVRFAGRILAIDVPIALACAALHVPDPRPDRDAWIAATALVNDMTVVTRNTRDFAATGARVFNPWVAGTGG